MSTDQTNLNQALNSILKIKDKKIRNNLLDKWAIRWEDIIMIFNPENAIIQRFASKYKNQS